MSEPINISNFSTLKLPDKIRFLEHGFMGAVQYEEGRVLNGSLNKIVLDKGENSYVRIIGLRRFIDLVAIGKIKDRQALSVLVDNWPSPVDIHIELQRLKDLYLFYDQEPEDIESIYQSFLSNEEAELVSESNLNLGLIRFQNALNANDQAECLNLLNQCKGFFLEAEQVIENRIDAFFYFKICSILIDLITCQTGGIQNDLQELGQLLFEKETYSIRFGELNQDLQFSLYKVLNALQKILNSQPKEWIEFKVEIERIMISFFDMKETNFKSRLNTQTIPRTLAEDLEKKFLQPFFVLNLDSDIERIKKLKSLYPEKSKEYDFLVYLESIIEGSDKKKIELESIENQLKLLFPYADNEKIKQLVSTSNKPEDYISIFEKLSTPSDNKLKEKIIFSCIKLQGDRKYRGVKKGDDIDENERNRYIANLIEASGFNVKDQPQWSESSKGKAPGEIDIFILRKNKMPWSIIEALNLTYLDTNYWAEHTDKLFKYDTTGLPTNYLIIYYLGKNFNSFLLKYKSHIQAYKYPYEFDSYFEDLNCDYADIKIFITKHLRNDQSVQLVHLVINMSEL